MKALTGNVGTHKICNSDIKDIGVVEAESLLKEGQGVQWGRRNLRYVGQ